MQRFTTGWFTRVCFMLLGLSAPAWVAAQGVSGQYRALVQGQESRLMLEEKDGQVSGTYVEEALTFDVEGTFQGRRIDASLTERQSGLRIAQLRGQWEGDAIDMTIDAHNPLTGARQQAQARFQREGASGSASRPFAGTGALDPALIGTWVHEKIINSGGGNFASFNTVLTMVLSPDGNVAQYSRSVGGGGDWSYDSDARPMHQGQWYAESGILYMRLDGATEFQAAARYRFSDAYLVTEDVNGRMIWTRR